MFFNIDFHVNNAIPCVNFHVGLCVGLHSIRQQVESYPVLWKRQVKILSQQALGDELGISTNCALRFELLMLADRALIAA
jgi:hypothetical protein